MQKSRHFSQLLAQNILTTLWMSLALALIMDTVVVACMTWATKKSVLNFFVSEILVGLLLQWFINKN